MKFHLLARTSVSAFLDLPWDRPLSSWESDRLVQVERGISRHVVRFINDGGTLYALKELPRRLADREYGLLRSMGEQSIPAVEVVGVVVDRVGHGPDGRPEQLEAVLITRHLEFSLPYRRLFTGHGLTDVRNRLLDALAELLVRLHLAGFYWGDCSLSNTLFRRDAGALAAYLVDAETGEEHPALTDGQRTHDLMIAGENITGELMDLEAWIGLPADVDPVETADEIRRRYGFLWSELTRGEIFEPDQRYLIDARLRRLNELGFDVEEYQLESVGEGYRMRLDPKVVEPGHHARRLLSLTGLQVQENQARRLLNDIAGFRAEVERSTASRVPEAVAAHRWLTEAFEPTTQAIRPDFGEKLEPAEAYHQILEHRWFLSEAAGGDVGLEEATQSFVETVLLMAPDERNVVSTGATGELPEVPAT